MKVPELTPGQVWAAIAVVAAVLGWAGLSPYVVGRYVFSHAVEDVVRKQIKAHNDDDSAHKIVAVSWDQKATKLEQEFHALGTEILERLARIEGKLGLEPYPTRGKG